MDETKLNKICDAVAGLGERVDAAQARRDAEVKEVAKEIAAL